MGAKGAEAEGAEAKTAETEGAAAEAKAAGAKGAGAKPECDPENEDEGATTGTAAAGGKGAAIGGKPQLLLSVLFSSWIFWEACVVLSVRGAGARSGLQEGAASKCCFCIIQNHTCCIPDPLSTSTHSVTQTTIHAAKCKQFFIGGQVLLQVHWHIDYYHTHKV